MDKSLELLSKEHENILVIAEALNRECDALESGKEIDKEFFKKALDFIKNYADKFHHAKEEDILFKELCNEEAKMHCNPIEQMLYEHDIGRNFVKEIEEGLKERNKEKIIRGARGYSNTLKDHIFKEDNVLYPMAEQVLNRKVRKNIFNKFMGVERSRFKRGTKENYLEMVRDFRKRIN